MSKIVGRTAECRVVADAVASVADGCGLLLSITGEPGVGKTHLAFEALRLAGDAGFRTLRGSCARYQQDVSFGPLLQALRPLVDPADPAARDRVAGLPELASLFTGLDLPEPESANQADSHHGRMFDAVYALLHRVAATRPLALLIDDIHWADPGTLDLLTYLALGLGEQACLFVVTDRGDPAEGVRRLRTPLRRADRVVDVRLGPLTRGDVAELVAHRLAGEPPQPLLELLDRRARGIPLYVTSLIASLCAQGRLLRSGGRWVLAAGPEPDVPDELVDVIADRLDELTAPEQDALSALSVWGDGASRNMLAALVDNEGLAAGLDRLIEAGLVDEQAGGAAGYQAHHPLLIEAIRARLSTRERRDRHAAAARYLLEHPGPPGAHTRAVAHHVRLAGPAFDPERALNLLTAAATDSTERSGHEDRLLADAVVALIRECRRSELLPAALERAAGAAASAGDIPGAVAAWREATDAHSMDPVAAGRCRCRLALLLLDQGSIDEADQCLDEALAHLAGHDDPASVRARFSVLQLRAAFSMRRSDRSRLSRFLPELREAAGRVGMPEVAEVYERYAYAGAERMTLPAAWTHSSELARVIARSGVREDLQVLLVPAYRPWIVDAIARGDFMEARRRSRTVPEQDRMSPGSGSAAIALEALSEWFTGSWDRALRLSGESLILGHRYANQRSVALALTIHALILAHRGELARAEADLAEARERFGLGDPHTVATMDTVEGQLALLRDRTEDGLAHLDRAGPVNYTGLLTLTLRATAAGRAGDRRRLDRIARDVEAVDGPWAAAVARRVHGMLQASPAMLIDAADRLRELGMEYESALGYLECAERHPEVQAVERAAAALSVFDRLGGIVAADRTRRLLRRLGHRPPPGRPTGGQLSGRELQVADLVAEGLTNAEVAARLFISQRTVTTHLDRIYRRLGLASRSELTRYVRDRRDGIRRPTDTGSPTRRPH